MSNDKVKVSDEFMEFYGKEQEKIEQVKQQEARTGNVPFELGAGGSCIVTGMSFGKSAEKEVENPETKKKETKPGCPNAQIEFTVIDHPELDGKKFFKTWWFWQNKTTSRAETFKQFLDDLEKRMGLPREVRENYQHPSELAKYYMEGPGANIAIRFDVIENKNNTYDEGKEIRISMPKDFIVQNDSILPPTQTSEPTSTEAPSSLAKGTKVTYLEQEWTVTEDYGQKIEIVNVDDPRIVKMIPKSALA